MTEDDEKDERPASLNGSHQLLTKGKGAQSSPKRPQPASWRSEHHVTVGIEFYPTEDRAAFTELLEALTAELAADGPLEKRIVLKIASLLWRMEHFEIFAVAQQAAAEHANIINGRSLPEAYFADRTLKLNAGMDKCEQDLRDVAKGGNRDSTEERGGEQARRRQVFESLVGKKEADKFLARVEEIEADTVGVAAIRARLKEKRDARPAAEEQEEYGRGDSIELAYYAGVITPEHYFRGLMLAETIERAIARNLDLLAKVQADKRRGREASSRRSHLLPPY
jgi:hypothetical protein